MKHISYLLPFLVLALSTACEDDKKSQLTTSVTQVTFETLNGSSIFDVSSNTDWRIISDADWISVTPSYGSGNETATITVAVEDNLFDKSSKVVVCTKDGEKVVNINVKVKGSKSDKEKYLDVKNHTTRLYMDGKAGTVDSLIVRANFNWEIKGPEWIEAWDGSRWRPLMQNRGVIKGTGIQTVMLRTTAENKQEETLEGIIKISEDLTGESAYTLNVFQLGRMESRPELVFLSPSGAVFKWLCGCDVDKIYFKVSEDVNENIRSLETIKNTFEVTDASILNSIDRLSPNTPFLITHCGEDSQGRMDKSIYRVKVSTIGDDQIVNISDLPYDPFVAAYQMSEKEWRIVVAIEDNLRYCLYATNSSNSAFKYNDQILGYLFLQELPKSVVYYSNTMVWNYTFADITNEIHAFIRILGSPKHIYRYDRYYDDDGKRLPDKPLLDRIEKDMIYDQSLRPLLPDL